MNWHLRRILLAVSLWSALFAGGAHAEDGGFQARMAAWQQPLPARSVMAGKSAAVESAPSEPVPLAAEEAYYEPVGQPVGHCDPCCGHAARGCANCCEEPGYFAQTRDPACSACKSCRPPMWWLRSEALLWWRQGRDLPVLVTSSDDPQALIGEIPLYGGEVEGGSPQGGARFDLGTWLDPEECIGVGWRIWGIGQEKLRFFADTESLPDQSIERLFFFSDGTAEPLVISDPNFGITGSIDVVSTSEIFGTDVYTRLHWREACGIRLDLVGGYQLTRINEELRIRSDADDGSGVDTIIDEWRTRNEFHGGTIGLLWESTRGCWTTRCLAKVGLGTMRQTVEFSGTENGVPPGLFVEAPGTVTRDEFAAVPELDLSWSYQINPCWNMSIGYSLMYWSSVARPEAMLDNVIDDGRSIIFRDDSLWVQGLTLGANCRF